jgi:CRP-like cAMP-binding protein
MLSIVEKVLFLRSVELFERISSPVLSKISGIAAEEQVSAGETIVIQDTVGESLYLIVNGTVDIIKDRRKVAVLPAGQCFGEMSLLDSSPRSATVVAATDVLLLRIDREEFFKLLSEQPEIAYGIIVVLTRRLRDANEHLTENKVLTDTINVTSTVEISLNDPSLHP